QSGDAPGVAASDGEADAQGDRPAVQPGEGEFETAGAPPLPLEPDAELFGHVDGEAGQILGRADRLGQGHAGEPWRRRAAEAARLFGSAERLVETTQRLAPEPFGERSARQGEELFKALEPQPLQ